MVCGSFGEVETTFSERRLRQVPGPGIQQVLSQLLAEQILRRQVGDELRLSTQLPIQGLDPALHQGLTDGTSERHVAVVGRGSLQVDALAVEQPPQELLSEGFWVGEMALTSVRDGRGHGGRRYRPLRGRASASRKVLPRSPTLVPCSPG